MLGICADNNRLCLYTVLFSLVNVLNLHVKVSSYQYVLELF